MPKASNMTAELVTNNTGSFGFSSTRPEELGSSEYTIVNLAVDTSGSVSNFKDKINECVRFIIAACCDPKNPKADNLLIRLIEFGTNTRELHGYKLTETIKDSDYIDIIKANDGSTALYDGMINGIESIDSYSKILKEQDYNSNAINIVITDGADNSSRFDTAKVKSSLAKAKNNGKIESILSILVGVNIDLSQLVADAGFDQFVEIDQTDKKSFMKLAKFISKSISSQSQSLGTGGPSKTIDPNSITM